MKKIFLILIISAIAILSAVVWLKDKSVTTPHLAKLKEKYSKEYKVASDHSQYPALQKNFGTPQEVTETCLTCHNQRHIEVMNSSHWNWERPGYIQGKGIVYLGKKNAVNNYCIGVEGSEQSCAKCHIGFGMTDELFSFTDAKNIDCMVCHDNSGTYTKGSELAGYPTPALNLNEIAQHIGRPSRENCGVCHFFGGGGNNVKHGDLEKSMFAPTTEIDIHMGIDGPNLVCVDCHLTENHQMLGKVYSLASMNMDRSECEQCHTSNPHPKEILNEHTLKVACQTCHIPIYAKENATKMMWDWSTAGKLKDGQPYVEHDSLGNDTYMSIKGSFKWEKNVVPDYIWFNGTADHYLLGDKIADSTQPLVLNQLNGSYKDSRSKIIPVKIHTGKQIFDPVNEILIQPKLFAKVRGEGAFWKDFDWNRAAEIGMKDAGLPYSGKYDFIETKMYWPVNHQVSKKSEALACIDCHTRDNSRLAGLDDFYMPGRDYNPLVDNLGLILIVLTFIGVVSHGGVRIYYAQKIKKGEK